MAKTHRCPGMSTHFCIVARPATRIWLLLQAPPRPKEKPDLPAVAPARPPPALSPTGELHQLM
jgi:hypothetical protein